MIQIITPAPNTAMLMKRRNRGTTQFDQAPRVGNLKVTKHQAGLRHRVENLKVIKRQADTLQTQNMPTDRLPPTNQDQLMIKNLPSLTTILPRLSKLPTLRIFQDKRASRVPPSQRMNLKQKSTKTLNCSIAKSFPRETNKQSR